MKPPFHRILLLGLLLLPSLRHSTAAESQSWAFVASYDNTREPTLTVGERISSILHRNKIKYVTVTGRGVRRVIIGVPPSQASEARLLLAQAIKVEKLPLDLLVREGNNLCVVVTPDSILEAKKDQ